MTKTYKEGVYLGCGSTMAGTHGSKQWACWQEQEAEGSHLEPQHEIE